MEDKVALVAHPDTGEIVGFTVVGWQEFDASVHHVLFTGTPRFAAPQMGLSDAGVGEICLAAKAWLPDEPTLNRSYFHMAMQAPTPAKAVETWLPCLEAGELQAHYSLGYTYFELGDLNKAYSHLRAFTEIARWNGWGWCWLGQPCEALGERVEARRAFVKALEIEEAGGHETDADKRLEELDRRVA